MASGRGSLRGPSPPTAPYQARDDTLVSSLSSLKRDLRLLDAVGIGLGAIIGAGIFVVTGIAAGMAGPAILISFAIAGFVATANALSSAALAAVYPQSGGTYEYGYQLLSPWLGFAAGWMFLASKIAAAGTVALGLGGYLTILWPAAQPRLLAVAAIVVFTILNYRGVQKSSRANLIVVAVSITALVLFVVVGAMHVRIDRLSPFFAGGWRGVFEAAGILFFAYTGYARIATLGEEVHEPAKTIPRAILITIATSLLLYAAVAFVAITTAGAPALAGSIAPLALAASGFGRGWQSVVAAGAVAAMLGVILSQLLGLSRMAFAMARRGDLPATLAAIHPRFGVPHRAVAAIGAVAVAVAISGGLQSIAMAAAFAILVYYSIANLAALRLPAPTRRYPRFVPVAGLAGCILLAGSLPARTILTGIAVLVGGLGARWIAQIATRPRNRPAS